MADQRRVYKVAEQLRSIVAMELHQLPDPRFNLVTITSVMLSPDLRHAKIYWTSVDPDFKREDVETAFLEGASEIRRVVAKKLTVRSAPELRFYFDETIEAVNRVEKLLNEVSRGKEK